VRSRGRALQAVIGLSLLLAGGASLGGPSGLVATRSPARGAAEELEEQRETTEQRLEALAAARAAGIFGARSPISREPAPGWVGERLFNPKTDDWEPAVAADPEKPYVYILATRYGEAKPCPGNCPTPYIALEISKDGGSTWSDGKPLCACKGEGQYDPIIEVVADTGDVYALYMNGYNVVFMKSSDHGKVWSDPVPTYGKVSWNDKPVLATSDDGRHVYVSWNGPQGGDPWIAQSHDYGETWTQTKVLESKRYFFAYDARVLEDGTIVFSESSLSYTGPGAAAEGQVWHHAFISRDRGTTWENVVIDRVELGEPCVAYGCYADFYAGQTSVVQDADGDLLFAYEGARVYYGKQRIYVRTSTDLGHTWGPRLALSPGNEMATGPRLDAFKDEIRVWYMQTSEGNHNRWNVWYRTSDDGGATWGPPVKISDATSGARYKFEDGFKEVYGDYGEIDVTNTGKTIAVWGEGFSWIGPGGAWFNLER